MNALQTECSMLEVENRQWRKMRRFDHHVVPRFNSYGLTELRTLLDKYGHDEEVSLSHESIFSSSHENCLRL